MKNRKQRVVKDFRKGIRKNPPKVSKSIDRLVDEFLQSEDYVNFHKRHDRK